VLRLLSQSRQLKQSGVGVMHAEKRSWTGVDSLYDGTESAGVSILYFLVECRP
jgi:hypothetical protein